MTCCCGLVSHEVCDDTACDNSVVFYMCQIWAQDEAKRDVASDIFDKVGSRDIVLKDVPCVDN